MCFHNYDNIKKWQVNPKNYFLIVQNYTKVHLQNVGREKFNIQKLATT